MENLTCNIKEIRKRLGLTQAQVAYVCEISPRTMMDIELGRSMPNAKTLYRISHYMKIPVTSLYSYHSDDPTYEEMIPNEQSKQSY